MGGFRSLLELLGQWLSAPPVPPVIGRVTPYAVAKGTATVAAVLGNTVNCYALPTGTATLYAED